MYVSTCVFRQREGREKLSQSPDKSTLLFQVKCRNFPVALGIEPGSSVGAVSALSTRHLSGLQTSFQCKAFLAFEADSNEVKEAGFAVVVMGLCYLCFLLIGCSELLVLPIPGLRRGSHDPALGFLASFLKPLYDCSTAEARGFIYT